MSEDAELVVAEDLTVRADYGQIYVQSSATGDDWDDADPSADPALRKRWPGWDNCR